MKYKVTKIIYYTMFWWAVIFFKVSQLFASKFSTFIHTSVCMEIILITV